jgi:hypothetical protein
MNNKDLMYDFVDKMISEGLVSKDQLIEVFIDILRKNFTSEEMMKIILGKRSETSKNINAEKKEEKKIDVMSYPSVIGIPINLIYNKIFTKKQ